MTDDQINEAIAEACGWTEIQTCTCWDDVFRGKPPGKIGLKHIEDYCNDLNAMHEAEKVLGKKLSEYGNQLCEMTIVSKDDFPECYIWHATARQRAEAFLRTLGKWEATTEESSVDQKEVQR